MFAKILAVVAAVLLVGSIALGTLSPRGTTLGEALAGVDHLRFAAVEQWVRNSLSAWVWEHPLASLLTRPVWLLPAACGLLCVGGALTVVNAQKAPNSRRRRS